MTASIYVSVEPDLSRKHHRRRRSGAGQTGHAHPFRPQLSIGHGVHCGRGVYASGYGDTGDSDTGEEAHTFGKTLQFGRDRYDFDYDDVPWVYEYDFDKFGDNSFNVTDGPAVGTDEVDIAPEISAATR